MEHANSLVLDAGNTWWGEGGLAPNTQGKVMVDAMNLIGYDAMALGETDLQLGEEALRQRLAEARFPVLSANVVVQSTGQLLARPYALLQSGGRMAGVIGLTGSGSVPAASEEPPSPAAAQSAPKPAPSPLTGPVSPTTPPGAGQAQPVRTHVIGGLAVVDPAAALARYVKELQAQTDLIIVLSNVGWDANLGLAETVRGIDLIVSGGPGQVNTQPWQAPETGTLVCQVGVYPQAHPGQLVGRVEMQIDDKGAVTQFSGDSTPLGSEFEDNSVVRKLLDEYQLQQ